MHHTVPDVRPSQLLIPTDFARLFHVHICDEGCAKVNAYYTPIRLINYGTSALVTELIDVGERLERKFQAVIECGRSRVNYKGEQADRR